MGGRKLKDPPYPCPIPAAAAAQQRAKALEDFTPSGPLLDIDKAAEYLSLSVSHLRTLNAQQIGPRRTRLPSRTSGNSKLVHYAKADLDAWINAHRD